MNTTRVMTGLELMAKANQFSGVPKMLKKAEWFMDTLDILSEEGKPMRAGEIAARVPGEEKPSVQKMVAILDDLIVLDKVERIVDPDETEFVNLYDDFGKMVPIARFMLK